MYYIQCFVYHFRNSIDKYDLDKDGHIDFKEFVQYVVEHEKQLKLFIYPVRSK